MRAQPTPSNCCCRPRNPAAALLVVATHDARIRGRFARVVELSAGAR
ncbi:MAG: hypothetical protein MZW92_39745 [Comamonadaceae bacterium]|nr:hypothetical protein [Comamonadaceae bacterium]